MAVYSDIHHTIWHCGNKECNRTCFVLKDGIDSARVGIDESEVRLQPHPRRGGGNGLVVAQVAESPHEEVAFPAQEVVAESRRISRRSFIFHPMRSSIRVAKIASRQSQQLQERSGSIAT